MKKITIECEIVGALIFFKSHVSISNDDPEPFMCSGYILEFTTPIQQPSALGGYQQPPSKYLKHDCDIDLNLDDSESIIANTIIQYMKGLYYTLIDGFKSTGSLTITTTFEPS